MKTFELGATREEENEKVNEWWLSEGEKEHRRRVEGDDVWIECLIDA